MKNTNTGQEPHIPQIKERSNSDLIELVCQLHHRLLINPVSTEMTDTYLDARKELESRMITTK